MNGNDSHMGFCETIMIHMITYEQESWKLKKERNGTNRSNIQQITENIPQLPDPIPTVVLLSEMIVKKKRIMHINRVLTR